MAVNILNLFEIENLPSLNCNYKLLEISGLPRNDNYDKNINLLKKKLAYELRKPIASIFKNNKHYIALPADCPNPELEQPLTPQVATLIPENKEYALNFDKLTKDTLPIALRFLEFSLSDPLWKNPELWNPFSGKRYYTRIPINKDDVRRDIDIYGGFTYNIIGLSDEKLYISVDLSYKYVDRYFLIEYLKTKNIKDFLKRHFIYHSGNNWYQVQLMGEAGQSIHQHKFQDKDGIIHNIYDYTIQKCSKPIPEYIQNLDPNSPAIVFKNSEEMKNCKERQHYVN